MVPRVQGNRQTGPCPVHTSCLLAVVPHPHLPLSEHTVFATAVRNFLYVTSLRQSPVSITNISWVSQQICATPNRNNSNRSSLNQVHKYTSSDRSISCHLAGNLHVLLHPPPPLCWHFWPHCSRPLHLWVGPHEITACLACPPTWLYSLLLHPCTSQSRTQRGLPYSL